MITSTRNDRIRAAATLRRARDRRLTGRHLVEGPRALDAALTAGAIEQVFAIPDAAEGLALPPAVELVVVADHVLDHLADARTPQGVVGVARTPVSDPEVLAGQRLVVVLEAVADPGNAGTIVRTADAAGAAAVVLTAGSVDAYAPKVVRASAGSVHHLPVLTGLPLRDVVAACRRTPGWPTPPGRLPVQVVGLDGAAEVTVFDLPREGAGVVLVLGNEAHGLSSEARGLVDRLARVPIRGRAESLNVAAAAAVATYVVAGPWD